MTTSPLTPKSDACAPTERLWQAPRCFPDAVYVPLASLTPSSPSVLASSSSPLLKPLSRFLGCGFAGEEPRVDVNSSMCTTPSDSVFLLWLLFTAGHTSRNSLKLWDEFFLPASRTLYVSVSHALQ